MPEPRILAASDRTLLVSWGDEISPALQRRVANLTRALAGAPVLNLHPGYATLLVSFDPLRISHGELRRTIENALASPPVAETPARIVEIPVRYDGPDLADVAAHTGLTPERVVELHASADYLVYFLGFSPGFPYLGGMPPELATPRLASPRKRVPAGSVAIGGTQTGVYPVESPGGWRIIGRTEMKLFDASADPPAVLRMGDTVRFAAC